MSQALSIEEFNQKVSTLLNNARVNFPLVNARLSQSALSLVKDRVINLGINAQGVKYPNYSTNKLPSFFFFGKGLSKGADDKMNAELKRQRKAKIPNPGISYEQWRDINGLQTNHVDLKFSGDTWRDIAVIETKNSDLISITTVASKGSINKKSGKGTINTADLTEILGERYGNFLELSDEEEKTIGEAFEAELQELIDNTFL